MRKILLIGSAGYVGSYLRRHLMTRSKEEGQYEVDTCDLSFHLGLTYHTSFQVMSHKDLATYSHVLFFAGVSSVKAATYDPPKAFAENCIDMYALAQKLNPNQKLIYASTGSLYSTSSPISFQESSFSSETDPLYASLNAYDASKSAGDLMISMSGAKATALRLGTVSGYSSPLREDLVFNAMLLSAIRHARVEVSNPNSWRSLLFLDDLIRLIHKLIEGELELPSVINVCSINTSIGDLALRISQRMGVKLVLIPKPIVSP